MWHWDQGHLEYFQFDAVRQLASYSLNYDFKKADRASLLFATGLPFAAPISHSPWRNYSRVLKLLLLVSEEDNIAKPTPVASILSLPGAVTCDEYLHFLLRAFTEPSPALKNWQPNANFRYPLLFALKYLLAKTASSSIPIASLDEIIGAYMSTGFIGDEDDSSFIGVIGRSEDYSAIGKSADSDPRRQARESLKVISQISYLHIHSNNIMVSLDREDAREIFQDLMPIAGKRAAEPNLEIRRIATLFRGGSTDLELDYPNTIIGTVADSGFEEGNKVKRTHVVIERNAGLRRAFFSALDTAICDICKLDTHKTYPWVERILDVHHLLPLCSGTRVEAKGTTFQDLVPVCPNCHRAVHRYYDGWLSRNNRIDFENGREAKDVYMQVKTSFRSLVI